MDAQTRARAEALLKSGKMSPEDAAALKAALYSHQPAEPQAPDLMDETPETLAANTARFAKEKSDRLSALDAGEAEVGFDAQAAGDAHPQGLTNKVQDLALQAAGMPPGERARRMLRQNNAYLDQRAALGDTAAAQERESSDLRSKQMGLGMALGLPFTPAATFLGAAGQGLVAGGASAAAESFGAGDEPRDMATKTLKGAGAGMGLNMLIHGVGALGRSAQHSLRENPDVGPDIQIAEQGGYKTSMTKGLKPPAPTGYSPGKRGVEQAAADIAPKAMGAAGAVDDALVGAHKAADEAYYASQAGQGQVDSTPIVQAFKRLIDARTFEGGQPIPETMASRLMKDASAFAQVQRVPIAQAEGVAARGGGIIIRPGLGASETGRLGPVERPGFTVSPGGRVSGPAARSGEPIPMGGTPARRALPPASSSSADVQDPDFIAGPDAEMNLRGGVGRPQREAAGPGIPMGTRETAVARVAGPGGVGPVRAPSEQAGGHYQAPQGRPDAAGSAPRDVRPEPVGGDYVPPGAPRDGAQQFAYVLVPRKLNARELEAVRNTFDSAGGVAGRSSEETAPFMEIANTARGMRKGFPGLEEMRASQSAEIGTMKNVKKAFGIPESKRLDPKDLAELRAVGDALQRYKAPGNLEADRVVDDFLAKNPDLAPSFQKLSGMSAAERVRGASSAGGGGHGVFGALKSMGIGGRLRLDPVMGAMGSLRAGGATAGTGGVAAEDFPPEFVSRIQQLLARNPQQEAQQQ